MREAPTNRDDIIDSRDVLERLNELTDERETLADALKEAEENCRLQEASLSAIAQQTPETIAEAESARDAARDALAAWDDDNMPELTALQSLANDAEGYGDWSHGETLIRRSHWVDYAQQLAEDIGAIKRDVSWPYNCIDWERAASELEADYMTVDFDGEEYLMRS